MNEKMETTVTDTTEQLTEEQCKKVAIDISCRVPIIFSFGSAVIWLLVSSLMGFLASMQLHIPEFMASCPLTSYGRLYPAFHHAFLYGWAATAGIGVGIWMLARLCRYEVKASWLLFTACALWNFGVTVDVGSILLGYDTTASLYVVSGYASLILFIAYLLLSTWIVKMIMQRPSGSIFVSEWFIIGGFFLFPWAFASAHVMLGSTESFTGIGAISGSFQGMVEAWFSHSILFGWLGALGLGVAYYLIPKITGRHIYSYYIAIFGFWSLMAGAVWGGGRFLLDGPIPVWMGSMGIFCAFLLVIPALTLGFNHHMNFIGHFDLLPKSPVIRFTFVGSICFVLAVVIGCFSSLREFSELLQFSIFRLGEKHLFLYGFFSMVMFAGIYYITPRLVEWEWVSPGLIRIHFWAALLGLSGVLFSLFMGGLLQGSGLSFGGSDFGLITEQSIKWLRLSSLSHATLLIANLAFTLSFLLIIGRIGVRKLKPTLFS